MRLVIFGSQGSLGSTLNALAQRQGIETLAYSHKMCDISSISPSMVEQRPDDVWINCAGILRNDQYSYPKHSDLAMVRTNALGPHNLANAAYTKERHLIHISTDSVFSGKSNSHQMGCNDVPDPLDLYGQTKLVGEAIKDLKNVTVLRTSFMSISSGLMRMVLDADSKGSPLLGHARSWWSGSTVLAVAEAIIEVARGEPRGLQQLSTSFPISKADALSMIARSFKLNVDIERVQEPVVSRGLVSTIKLEDFNTAVEKYARHLRGEAD